jgi:hypothetical protein
MNVNVWPAVNDMAPLVSQEVLSISVPVLLRVPALIGMPEGPLKPALTRTGRPTGGCAGGWEGERGCVPTRGPTCIRYSALEERTPSSKHRGHHPESMGPLASW